MERSLAAGLIRPLRIALPRRSLPRRLRLRAALLGAAVALPLLGGGWLWLRDSSLVAVEQVRISGVHGVDAARIEAALSGAARRMSTLDAPIGALRAAVAQFPVVRDLRVSPSFPHGLRIHVIEQPPVATLVVGGRAGPGGAIEGGARTAVAADGVVLGPALLSNALPVIHAAGAQPLLVGDVRGAELQGELRVLGAAPGALLRWVQRIYTGREGLTVVLRDGLEIYFGNATRPHAKWLSAARVLADPSAQAASYVDVRLPERPAAGSTAAGGLEGAASTPAAVGASDPTAAALAAMLNEAVAGGAGAASSASTAAAAGSAEAGSGAAGGSTQAGSAAAGSSTAGSPEGSGGAVSSTAGSAAPAGSPAEAGSAEAGTGASLGAAGGSAAGGPAGAPSAPSAGTGAAEAPATQAQRPEPSASTSG